MAYAYADDHPFQSPKCYIVQASKMKAIVIVFVLWRHSGRHGICTAADLLKIPRFEEPRSGGDPLKPSGGIPTLRKMKIK